MSGKQPVNKARKNRLKKSRSDVGPGKPILLGRLLTGIKLIGLIVLLSALSIVFVLIYGAVTTTDYFSTKTITVTGNHHVSKQQLLSQAGLELGDNLLSLNLRIMRQRLIAHPWVATARVSRNIPHTINIAVEEQHPLAVLDLATRYLINEKGRIFKAIDHKDPNHLPVVSGLSYSDLSLDDAPLSQAMETVLKVLLLSRDGRCPITFADIEELCLDKETGVTLKLKEDGGRIKLGKGRFEEKYRNLGRLLKYIQRRPHWREYYALDVTNPERIVLQPEDPSQKKTKGA